ncbi:hypothetical protein CLAFUW4_13787 [Fulvia fulva]|nr:hypothetical protein CLAFUR4_13790 [Fulvia fulva]KAK4610950.1 hypothetical protein CLAFUR0_13794 [Fulvia fulva]WPV21716.1 hypothetical protein CLAFUW4_13787 [Fulvia fulva]
MAPPPIPETLPDLLAWIASTGPYSKIDHTTANFPNVNDFMIKELEAALVQAVDNLKGARERLRTIPGPGGAFAGCAALATTSRALIHHIDSSGLLSLSHPSITRLVIAAKYQGKTLEFQNILVTLALSTKKLKDETRRVRAAVSKYQREVQAKEMLMGMLASTSSESIESNGDGDDWFVVGSERETPASTPGGCEWEQEKLYEEIEVKLAGVPMGEGDDGKRVAGEGGARSRSRQETIVVAIDDVAPYYYR